MVSAARHLLTHTLTAAKLYLPIMHVLVKSDSRRIYARRYAPVDVAMIGVGNVCVELSDVQVFILAEIQRRYILSFSAFIYTYGMECPIDIFGALDGSQITEASYVTMLVYVGTGRTILWRQLVRRRKSPLSESLRKRTIW